jgi:hypothetical protein
MKRTAQVNDPLTLINESLKKAISYGEYRKLVADHVQKGTSTGPNQNDELSHFTLLNDSRMRRLDKTLKLPLAVQEKLENFKGNQTWLVLSESWCGDAAHALPVMNKMAEATHGIDFKVVLRDENLNLMNAFLTNGAMSIPKLIAIDSNTGQVLANWGARPSVAKAMVKDYKEEHGKLTPEFKQELQIWYNKDKGQNIAEDLAKLIE